MAPSLILTVSGSKSQPASGVPEATLANKSDNVVNAPSVTFLQKSGPSAALKVTGSHSSKATTCGRLGECRCGECSSASARVAPAKIKQPPSAKDFRATYSVRESLLKYSTNCRD